MHYFPLILQQAIVYINEKLKNIDKEFNIHYLINYLIKYKEKAKEVLEFKFQEFND